MSVWYRSELCYIIFFKENFQSSREIKPAILVFGSQLHMQVGNDHCWHCHHFFTFSFKKVPFTPIMDLKPLSNPVIIAFNEMNNLLNTNYGGAWWTHDATEPKFVSFISSIYSTSLPYDSLCFTSNQSFNNFCALLEVCGELQSQIFPSIAAALK